MSGVEAARAILRANDRGGYTVPTARLYPFQWNWDSAFVAMGWSTFDEAAAWREVESLLAGQWDDGMIPHIVFHAPADTYFPGPEVWGTKHRVPTSGITQPPVLASAVRRLWARGAEDRAAAIYPKLLANHRWWRRARDPEDTGLVAILHPWESGMDNSPAWDRAMTRVPTETVTKIVRRDTGHVDPTHRPLQIDYQRFIHIVDTLRGCAWEPARMWAKAPLKIADIATNSILARAEADLLALAARFGTDSERREIEARAEKLRAGIARSWREGLGLYASVDLFDRTPIDVPTSAGFLPLYGGVATRAAELGATLDRWAAKVRVLVPSTPPDWPGFEARRYWRGPVWAVVNWMIAEGFAEAGDVPRAMRIRQDTREAIARGGFCENFDPLDGTGGGGGTFSWTAAIDLLLNEAA
jgi:glycogen debranching enzyme